MAIIVNVCSIFDLSLDDKAAPMPATIASTSTVSSSAAPRSRNKWDSFKAEDENGKAEEDANIDDFFKKLYADADDDTRRAMMKSYQESGGTALSTNWTDVSKGKVETKAPDGMEARKW
jgi:suppressor of G2 allele of SKP1